jgi:hypothetical protein
VTRAAWCRRTSHLSGPWRARGGRAVPVSVTGAPSWPGPASGPGCEQRSAPRCCRCRGCGSGSGSGSGWRGPPGRRGRRSGFRAERGDRRPARGGRGEQAPLCGTRARGADVLGAACGRWPGVPMVRSGVQALGARRTSAAVRYRIRGPPDASADRLTRADPRGGCRGPRGPDSTRTHASMFDVHPTCVGWSVRFHEHRSRLWLLSHGLGSSR